MNTIIWSDGARGGTSLQGYLDNLPWSFEESVARLKTLSGQDPTAASDKYKTSVEFGGTFNGRPFTLYDYKEGRQLHIGGTSKNYIPALKQHLLEQLKTVAPTPYTATEYYDDRCTHRWPLSPEPSQYTVIVTVTADSQREAFQFVEQALTNYVEKHEDIAPEDIHLLTPDGTHSVEL